MRIAGIARPQPDMPAQGIAQRWGSLVRCSTGALYSRGAIDRGLFQKGKAALTVELVSTRGGVQMSRNILLTGSVGLDGAEAESGLAQPGHVAQERRAPQRGSWGNYLGKGDGGRPGGSACVRPIFPLLWDAS